MLEYVDWIVLQSVSGNNRHVYYNRDNTHVLTVEYTTRQQHLLTTIDLIITTYMMATITLEYVGLITCCIKQQ